MRLVIIGAAGIGLMVFIVQAVIGTVAKSHADYRDPVQLAQAIQAKEHGTAADCSKLPTGKYICAVARTGGAMGSYQVTVSADGKSWSAS